MRHIALTFTVISFALVSRSFGQITQFITAEQPASVAINEYSQEYPLAPQQVSQEYTDTLTYSGPGYPANPVVQTRTVTPPLVASTSRVSRSRSYRPIVRQNPYRSVPITQRPSRPGHVYGNTVRLIYRVGR